MISCTWKSAAIPPMATTMAATAARGTDLRSMSGVSIATANGEDEYKTAVSEEVMYFSAQKRSP